MGHYEWIAGQVMWKEPTPLEIAMRKRVATLLVLRDGRGQERACQLEAEADELVRAYLEETE